MSQLCGYCFDLLGEQAEVVILDYISRMMLVVEMFHQLIPIRLQTRKTLTQLRVIRHYTLVSHN